MIGAGAVEGFGNRVLGNRVLDLRAPIGNQPTGGDGFCILRIGQMRLSWTDGDGHCVPVNLVLWLGGHLLVDQRVIGPGRCTEKAGTGNGGIGAIDQRQG